MRVLVGLLLAATLGCEKRCEEPTEATYMRGYTVSDPAGILAYGAELGDGGVSDACAAIRGCTERCSLVRVPNGRPVASDVGPPDTSACPATPPTAGTSCTEAIKCSYPRGEEICWAACSEVDGGRSWSVSCAKPEPPPPPPPDCPDAMPEVGSACGVPRMCIVAGKGLCDSIEIACGGNEGWYLRTCIAGPGEDWNVACHVPVVHCRGDE